MHVLIILDWLLTTWSVAGSRQEWLCGRYRCVCGRGRRYRAEMSGLYFRFCCGCPISGRCGRHTSGLSQYMFIVLTVSFVLSVWFSSIVFTPDGDLRSVLALTFHTRLKFDLKPACSIACAWGFGVPLQCSLVCISLANEFCLFVGDCVVSEWMLENPTHRTDTRRWYMPLRMVTWTARSFWSMPAPTRRPRARCVDGQWIAEAHSRFVLRFLFVFAIIFLHQPHWIHCFFSF